MESCLSFLGDAWLPEPFKSELELRGPYVFNLESPITRRGRPALDKLILRAERPFYVETFGRKPLAVCLANNHIGDYGAEGLDDTIAALDAEGIGHFGAGALEADGGNPLLVETGGMSVGLMGYVCPTTHPVLARAGAPGAMLLELSRIDRDIERARRRGSERVVVQLHWGHEHVHLPKPEDVRIARAIVDLGADLVIGHHAHCIQACETHRGKPIFYGLGNAVFPERAVPKFAAVGEAPARWYTGAQRYWNKRSLLVEYDARSGSASARELSFEDGTLAETRPAHAPPYRLDLGRSDYPKRYARGRALSALRGAAADFVRQPKLPRLAHLQRLYRVIASHG